MIGSGDLAWRLTEPGPHAAAPPGLVALSLAAAAAACTGGFLGGKLVFGHGIGVTVTARIAGGAAAWPDKDLPEPAAEHDHGRGAQDAPDARVARAGTVTAAGGRRRRTR
jgi:hypothetical protein